MHLAPDGSSVLQLLVVGSVEADVVVVDSGVVVSTGLVVVIVVGSGVVVVVVIGSGVVVVGWGVVAVVVVDCAGQRSGTSHGRSLQYTWSGSSQDFWSASKSQFSSHVLWDTQPL